MLDFAFATQQEICTELGLRLKRQRLAQQVTQKDLAARAGVSSGTVKNLESKGQASLESLVRIVMALNLSDELGGLFQLQITSIADMARNEQAQRVRASATKRGTKA